MKPLDPLGVDLEKTTLIEASAGTGKTYTITTLFLRLLAAGYPVETILVVTFTEAAAAELKLRIRSRLSRTLRQLEDGSRESDDELVGRFRQQDDPGMVSARLALALTCFDQAAVMTIHSFCYKVLKAYSFESRSFFDMEIMPDQSAFLRQAGYDFFMAHVNPLDPLFLSYMNTERITPERFIRSFAAARTWPDLSCVPGSAEFTDFFPEYRQVTSRVETHLAEDTDGICALLAGHKGIDKRSYSKKNVPGWLKATQVKLSGHGANTFFKMEEKGDAIYKFTRARLKTKTKAGASVPDHPFFDCCERLLELAGHFPANLIALKLKFIAYLKTAAEKNKTDFSLYSFDDLVLDLARKLEAGSPGSGDLKRAVRQAYRACLIDEFQDTDPRQYDIFATVFSVAGTPFFMIGDPKQAIYAFRGGDIFAYLKASRQSEQRYTLDRNFRSAPLLVRGVNQVFTNRPDPFLYEDIVFLPVGTPETARNRLVEEGRPTAPLQFCFVRRDGDAVPLDRQGLIARQTAETMIPDMVAGDILDLLSARTRLENEDGSGPRPVRPADIAVLVRTNDQAGHIQQALSNRHIPCYQSKTGSVFDSAQAVELNDILYAVRQPENTSFVKAALCSPVFGLDSTQVHLLDKDDAVYLQWIDFFRECRRAWEKSGFVSMMMRLLHSRQAFLKDHPDLRERGLTNFYHLIELISQACLKFRFSACHLMRWYAAQLNPLLRDASADELRLESDKSAVAIVTIHKSKGLEYPVVYLPYLWEGQRAVPDKDILYHDPSRGDRLTLDLGSPRVEAAKEQYLKEVRAEQRRLLYVAMTRASAMCRIVWGAFAPAADSSLGALIHDDGSFGRDQAMLDDLEQIISRAPSSIRCDIHRPGRSPRLYQADGNKNRTLQPRSLSRVIRPVWEISSFSAVAHSGGHPEPKAGIPDPKAVPTPVIASEHFPKGAGAGDFFHAVFETIDFAGPDSQVRPHVDTLLPRFGFSPEDLGQVADTLVRQVLETPLGQPDGPGDGAFRLKDIPVTQRINEMGFTLPVRALNTVNLARALKLSDLPLERSGYPDLLRSLDPATVNGYLKGFIDLVVRHENRYYIIDYKSNYLGGHYGEYASDAMHTAMARHHYYLQYHFYTLALHRYLACRIPDYRYTVHFGGVFYLFIRGMHPDFGARYGVFYDRPPERVIRFLSDTL